MDQNVKKKIEQIKQNEKTKQIEKAEKEKEKEKQNKYIKDGLKKKIKKEEDSDEANITKGVNLLSFFKKQKDENNKNSQQQDENNKNSQQQKSTLFRTVNVKMEKNREIVESRLDGESSLEWIKK